MTFEPANIRVGDRVITHIVRGLGRDAVLVCDPFKRPIVMAGMWINWDSRKLVPFGANTSEYVLMQMQQHPISFEHIEIGIR